MVLAVCSGVIHGNVLTQYERGGFQYRVGKSGRRSPKRKEVSRGMELRKGKFKRFTKQIPRREVVAPSSIGSVFTSTNVEFISSKGTCMLPAKQCAHCRVSRTLIPVAHRTYAQALFSKLGSPP
ncbi:hypothetical protein HPB49_003764 [Dermacentor silvarum]|uniref:Uncharacterized protein n=1 Tax=Dermacentor silvarum TaxID=543639 RepID=A0ACB8DU42_DERSI|nr:hypothetical protein HPB49_003764 [Dermacentor silvarum]